MKSSSHTWQICKGKSSGQFFLTKETAYCTLTALRGGIVASVVDVRVLFRMALEHYATGIIVAHNHPTGVLAPSTQDVEITRQIKAAGSTLQIQLLDHLIIGQGGFYSFAEEGAL